MIQGLIIFVLGIALGFYAGQTRAKSGKFYKDLNNDNIPDVFQKGGRPKGSKNKPKK